MDDFLPPRGDGDGVVAAADNGLDPDTPDGEVYRRLVEAVA